MKTYVVTWPDMEIHREGCSQLKRPIYERREVIEADSPQEVAEICLDDELKGMGYRIDHFIILPCTRHAKEQS